MFCSSATHSAAALSHARHPTHLHAVIMNSPALHACISPLGLTLLLWAYNTDWVSQGGRGAPQAEGVQPRKTHRCLQNLELEQTSVGSWRHCLEQRKLHCMAPPHPHLSLNSPACLLLATSTLLPWGLMQRLLGQKNTPTGQQGGTGAPQAEAAPSRDTHMCLHNPGLEQASVGRWRLPCV